MSTLRRIILLVFLLIIAYNLVFIRLVFPGISVAGISLSGQKLGSAIDTLSSSFNPNDKITLEFEGRKNDLSSKDIELVYDLPKTAKEAYNLTRTGNFTFDLYTRLSLLIKPRNIGVLVSLNQQKLDEGILNISKAVSKDPVYPSINLVEKNIVVTKGEKGSKINIDLLKTLILKEFSLPSSNVIQIPVEKIDPTLSGKEINFLKQRAEKYIDKKLLMTFEFDTFSLDTSDLIKLINPKGGLDDKAFENTVLEIASKINRPPQDPKFLFNPNLDSPTNRVTEFLPARDGVELKVESFKQSITDSMIKIETSDEKLITFEIPVTKIPPKISTDEINNLGIKELVGRGTSTFKGSIPSRVHNVSLAASRLNGILIKPGEAFSFNETLGDISAFTGYKQAYVIKEGKTVLGDGGGVCQVSTTLFRAALNAGLPIPERQSHAYRVGYYEQDSPPGLDATVYGPSPDLKILNDTNNHILIQATTDIKNFSLVFELYGTKDDRVVTLTKPVVSNITSPGEDLYIDDPTLPIGTVRQTEHRANGARVTFSYTVQKGTEEPYKKMFISNYRPWQAVYLRGTAPAQ